MYAVSSFFSERHLGLELIKESAQEKLTNTVDP